jgi:hypothetical protein
MDGAHTHHHRPGGAGIGTVLLVGVRLAVATQAVNAVASVVHVLLTGLAIVAALALTALAAYAVAVHRRRRAAPRQPAPGPLPPMPEDPALPGDREVVSLRQAITELHAQLAAARTSQDTGHRSETHQHLHFHGLDPAQVAAILAAHRRQDGDDR